MCGAEKKISKILETVGRPAELTKNRTCEKDDESPPNQRIAPTQPRCGPRNGTDAANRSNPKWPPTTNVNGMPRSRQPDQTPSPKPYFFPQPPPRIWHTLINIFFFNRQPHVQLASARSIVSRSLPPLIVGSSIIVWFSNRRHIKLARS